jgi:hypothetical protein
MKPLVIYAAPGAGLGHLVRACGVGSALRALGLTSRIVTHSRYTNILGPLTGLNIDFIHADKWTSDFIAYVDRFRPSLVVLDVFPWGIRGEALALAGRYATVLMARRLKTKAYLEAAGLDWNASSPLLKRVIAAEPLNPDMRSLLLESDSDIRPLPGRIRLEPPRSRPPEPEALTRRLEHESVRLVVHSGPESEVRELVARARAIGSESENASVVAILPRPMDLPGLPVFHYFPASVFYSRATQVITGGGYNSLAETSPYPDKGLHLPFDRHYDDQAGRIAASPLAPENGGPEAARIIASWI